MRERLWSGFPTVGCLSFCGGKHYTERSLLTEKRYFCLVVHTLAFDFNSPLRLNQGPENSMIFIWWEKSWLVCKSEQSIGRPT